MAYPKSSYKKSGWCALPYLSPFPFYTSIQMKMGVKREREEFGISLCFGPSKKNNGKRQLTLRKLLVKWARERERDIGISLCFGPSKRIMGRAN